MNQIQLSRSIAPSASRILRPGVRVLPRGAERHVIKGQGSLVVPVVAGDLLQLTDIEGGQSAEILFCDGQGKFDTGSLGQKPNGTGEGLKAILASAGLDATRSRKALQSRGIDLGQASSINLFGHSGRAGDQASFTAGRDGFLIVVAPAAVMDAHSNDTATDIELKITRVNPKYKNIEALPDPLADPLQDIRIRAATANAYMVKAGEYIQIIDVSGRQMTDFQCFSVAKLDKGIENALDATVTRTLSGRAYPIPGLPSKAFGFDF